MTAIRSSGEPERSQDGQASCRWLLAILLALAVTAVGADVPEAHPPLAPNLELNDVSGKPTHPLADEGQKATLLFFLMHDCPVANGYAPEINRMVAEYGPRKIRSYVVYVESDLTAAQARKHVSDYGFKCGALLDPKHVMVKAAGATVSPEAALISPSGELLYRGRIDDRAAGFGKRRVQPTQRDLRLALEAFMAGQKIPARLTRAIGCYIPDDPPVTPGVKATSP